jgi:uncharacterized protein YqgV (UPF0045/DUF77 family)
VAQHVSIEFTIEPFTDGSPGAHVTNAVAAVEALGVAVDLGPFGSSCVVVAEQAGAVVAALLNAAYANGATHVSVHAERMD